MSDVAAAHPTEPLAQGDPALLKTEAAQRLLASRIPARLAYIAADGTPRVVPSWFHWNGKEVVTVTYIAGPNIRHRASRIAALRANPAVALSIDTESSPPTALSIRGRAEIIEVEGIAPEYRAAALRYLGEDAGEAMLAEVDRPGTVQARIVIKPEWVGLVDFVTRLPSAQGGVQIDGGSDGTSR